MAKATTKTKPATKRRKPGRKPVLVGHYTLEIDTWQVGYSFAAGEGRDFTRGPYYEHLDLEITAHFLEPDQHQGKSVNMVLLGNRGVDALMDEDDPRCDQAKSVGHLDVRGERRSFLGTLPMSALWGLVPALDAGSIKFIQMTGDPLHRGSASIRWISFSREREE